MRRDVRSGRHAALRAALVLLFAVTGLACGQITSAADTGRSPAAVAVQPTDTSSRGAASASDDADAAFTGTGCTGKQGTDTEPPVSSRAHLDAPAPSVERPVARTAQTATDGPCHPGGPAPPPSVPLFEALSVLRV